MDFKAVIMAAAHNDSIPDIMRATTRAAILEAETTIAQLDNEIARLGSAIRALERQRSDTVVQIRQYQSAIAPHRFVPNEILGEIFLHCNPDNVAVPWELEASPWTLSHVCRRWRSVALGTHSLWRHIEIQLEFDGGPYPRLIDMTMELIRRGGNRHISMAAESMEVPEFPNGFLDFVNINLPLFEGLSIGGRLPELMPLLTSPSGNTKELQRLEIKCYDSGVPQLPLTFLEGASLQELRVNYPIPSTSLLQLSLSKITILCLQSTFLKSDDIFTLLSRCLFIKECYIGMCNPPALPIQLTPESRSLTLPCLETLLLLIHEPRSAPPSLLAALVMPRLSDLTVSGRHEWDMDLTLALFRPGCHIQSFDIHSSLSEADLDILIPAIPDIQHIAFNEAVLSTQMLQGIANGTLLPDIKRSFFTCVMHTLDALDLHLNMLEQRFTPNSVENYGFLNLRLLGYYSRDDLAPKKCRVREMRAAGWNLIIC